MTCVFQHSQGDVAPGDGASGTPGVLHRSHRRVQQRIHFWRHLQHGPKQAVANDGPQVISLVLFCLRPVRFLLPNPSTYCLCSLHTVCSGSILIWTKNILIDFNLNYFNSLSDINNAWLNQCFKEMVKYIFACVDIVTMSKHPLTSFRYI